MPPLPSEKGRCQLIIRLNMEKRRFKSRLNHLQAAISSMELPKNFENKKLPNTLRRLAFLPFHL